MKTVLTVLSVVLSLAGWAARAGEVVAWGSSATVTNGPGDLTGVVAMAAGINHNVALRSNGTVVAWGSNSLGQTNVPVGLSNVVAVAAGLNHSLALLGDGTVTVWGAGATNTPPLSNLIAVAGGQYHSLALRADGTLVAWGGNANGQTNVPSGLADVVAIAAGTSHCLVLRADGTVVAWGDNAYGQTNVPATLSNVVAISAGVRHNLALTAEGALVVWGSNAGGQTNVPAGLSNVVACAGGLLHSLALLGDGRVVAWGSGAAANVPAALSNLRAIAVGLYHSLALRGDGSPTFFPQPALHWACSGQTTVFRALVAGAAPLSYQWQFNGTDLAGATNASLVLSETKVTDGGSYRCVVGNSLGFMASQPATLTVLTIQPQSQTVLALSNITFRVTASGGGPFTYQWKRNGLDLSDGDRISGSQTATLTLSNAQPADSGRYWVVVGNAYGMVPSAQAVLGVVPLVAWGDNTYGQSRIPLDLTNAVAVAAGGSHSLALTAEGRVVAWGDNSTGQTTVPSGLSHVVALAAGGYHSLALTDEGRVVAWGDNYLGKTNVPSGLSNVVAIAAGGYHSLALTAEGRVVAWGGNYDGQATVPGGLSNVVALAAGGYHSLALTAEGRVMAWGDSRYGQTTVPGGLSNVVAIAAGWYHNLALTAEGRVMAWGDNRYGQTTVPSGLSNVVAIVAAWYHNLALTAEGWVVAWGDNRYGQTTVPSGLSNVVAIAAGNYYSLALAGSGRPVFTVQPVGQTLIAGQAAQLLVMAVGPGPLSFQWQCNGSNLPGATNGTLTLPIAQGADAGGYSVVVSNVLGAVTSRVAQLTVLVPPSFDPLPASTTVGPGSNITFSVDATGTPPLGYQWRKNGVNIPGATNSWLTITNVQVSDGGSYSVVVANLAGSATNDPLLLLVEVPQPGDQPPQLNIHFQSSPPGLVLEWPTNASCYQLEATDHLSPPRWTDATVLSSDLTNGLQRVTVDWSAGTRFFRLRKP